MINIRVQTKFNHIPAIIASVRPAVSQVIRKTALDVETKIKNEMRKPKSGRKYVRVKGQGLTRKGTERKRKSMHQASAPGEAPAVDFGQLINSIQVENVTDLKSAVGTSVEYAMPLEFGSRRLAPRPVWRPVIEKMRKPFIAAMTFVLRQLK